MSSLSLWCDLEEVTWLLEPQFPSCTPVLLCLLHRTMGSEKMVSGTGMSR
jgi:hypothetical protein